MAELPEPMHSIENLIYAAYERAADNQDRPHLGASLIGRPCDRALWYLFRWAAPRVFEGRMLRLFETGQLEEARFVANLRAIGCEVHETDPTGAQWRVSDIGAHFGGSMDAAATHVPGFGKQWCVVEMKTHNEKSFNDLKKHGVRESKPEHYAQMVTYMGETGMERALYLAKNKNDDELYSEKVEFDPVEFARIRARAERIITATEPLARLSNDPSWWQCKMCDYHAICHGEALPKVNCRTCAHSTPELDGDARWSCAHHMADIPLDAQRTGCGDHRYIPVFFQRFAEQTDVRGTDVVYRALSSGKEFVNGASGLSSKELFDLDHKPSAGAIAEVKADLAAAGISCTVIHGSAA